MLPDGAGVRVIRENPFIIEKDLIRRGKIPEKVHTASRGKRKNKKSKTGGGGGGGGEASPPEVVKSKEFTAPTPAATVPPAATAPVKTQTQTPAAAPKPAPAAAPKPAPAGSPKPAAAATPKPAAAAPKKSLTDDDAPPPPKEKGTATFFIKDAKIVESHDVVGKGDPYVVIQIAGQKKQSSVKKDTQAPKWNEKIAFDDIPLATPNIALIEIWDEDKVTKDDLIGSISLPIIAGGKNPNSLQLNNTEGKLAATLNLQIGLK